MIAEKYEFKEVEKKWQNRWEKRGIYAWNPSEPKEGSYIIDTPPPTVSGYLHIGHVYSYTQTDLIARYRRMAGYNVFYPMGFDDNGLPTERLVEQTRKIRAVDMSREDFIAICHEVVRGAEADFRQLFKSIALSVDWSLEYQTVGTHCRKISQLSALDLFHKNQLYRRLQPSLWDPIDRTALAQAEIVDKELPGTMHEVVFGLESGGEVVIGTTRPELIGACGALMIHPDHPRQEELLRTRAISPLFSVPVPVIVDQRVDPDVGSGVVMCCTFGDTTDIEWWKTYDLPTRVILNKSGRLTDMSGLGAPDWPTMDLEHAAVAASELAGLKVEPARQKIVEMLKARGLIRNEAPVVRMVPCAERSGAPLEILVTPQWFVRTLDKKEALLQRGREIRWFPQYMQVRYETWVENLRWDWCISRQRYFGVPFPFWYSKRPGEEGRVIAAEAQDLPVNPLVGLPRGYAAHEVEADPDVMDTWATSSVSPQINGFGVTAEYVLNPDRYRKLFPATLRPQAHEIIRTWAFYTILKANLHDGRAPWKDIAISGWCLAPDRSKMSKSKGNVITPESLLERHGADPIRYWTATSKLGLDTALSEDVIKQGRRMITKLWNASRFAALQIQGFEGNPTSPAEDFRKGLLTDVFDLWILGRLGAVVTGATEAYEEYEYADALRLIEHFFWNDLCDNYLELVKGRAYGDIGNAGNQRSARFTLCHCLEIVLRLLAPTLPHVTEEIFSEIFPRRFEAVGSLHARGHWPRVSDQLRAPSDAERAGTIGIEILTAVRKLKSQRQVSLRKPIVWCHVSSGPAGIAIDRNIFAQMSTDLRYAVVTDNLELTDVPSHGDTIVSEDGSLRVSVAFAP